jgi:hypothetical protein
VFVQGPEKWYRFRNPDFSHDIYRVSKTIRKETICHLLKHNNLNIDTAGDIRWLYFWANNGGVKVDVEYNIHRLQFLEFDRFNQQRIFNDFVGRVVRASQLTSLKMRFGIFQVEDNTADEIIQDYDLDQLRSMRGLKLVKVWLWSYGDFHNDGRMLYITDWLREEMYKEKSEEDSEDLRVM